MLTNLINKFRSNSLLIKILLSYTVIGILLFVAFSFIILNNYYSNSIREIDALSEKMLDQSYKVAETYWDPTFSDLYELFYQENEFSKFNTSDTYDTDLIIGIYNRMKTEMSSPNHMLYSIYLYNPRMDLVVSNLTSAMKIGDFFDRDIISILNSGKIDREIYAVPRKLDYRFMTTDIKKNVITVIFSHRNETNKVTDAMVFNLDQKSLQDLVSEDGTDSSNQLLIINNKGEVISDPDGSKFGGNILNESYIRKILDSRDDRGKFTTRINSSNILVTYIKSNKVLDWVFINLGDYGKLKNNIYAYEKTILLFTGIFIILGILIAAFFTKSIYNPIYSLLQKIKVEERQKGPQQRQGEVEYISSSYEKLKSNVKNLEVTLQNSLKIEKQELLRKAINGEIVLKPDEIRRLELDSPYHAVCVVRIDSFRRMAEHFSLKDMALYRFAVGNMASDLFKGEFSSNVTDADMDSTVIVLNLSGNDGALLEKAGERLRELQACVQKYLEFTVTASIGNIVDSMDEIRNSYKNAYYASNYRLKYGKNSLISYGKITLADREPYKYPLELEAQLTSCVSNCDRNGIEKIVNQVISTVGRFSCDEILLSVYQLMLSTTGFLRKNNHLNSDAFLIDFDTIHQKLSYCDEIDEIKALLLDFYSDIADTISFKKYDKSEETVKTLIKYINDHFLDPNISAEILSDIVGLSTNYIRRVFREHTNKSVSNYINELRFEKAKNLLGETDLPAYRISEMLGFQSSAYFYVAFRKYQGKSPDEYRREFTIEKNSKTGG